MNIREIINEDTVDVGIGITILIDLSQPNTPNATHLTRSTHDFVHHRRSEIAVRKVYGATTRQIVEMLNLRYVWIVGGCFVWQLLWRGTSPHAGYSRSPTASHSLGGSISPPSPLSLPLRSAL